MLPQRKTTANMSCVHYKFFAKLAYDTLTFDGFHISLCDLKKKIMVRERLKAFRCDLQITDAQTQEEYTEDAALIPRHSSVIVRRIPSNEVKTSSKTYDKSRSEPVSGTSKAKQIDEPSPSISLAKLAKTGNLAEADASEEDKIKAVSIQSGHEYDAMKYMKKPLGPPPPSYICYRCLKPGHYIYQCPTNSDESFNQTFKMKRSAGIPRTFMVEVEDPNMKGAMLTNTGKYAIPSINATAYAVGKKERQPFLPANPSSSSEEEDPVPDKFLCLICKEIMTDAVVIPCCGNSYCDECIRSALLDSEEHMCPTCHQKDVSPDSLDANMMLRQCIESVPIVHVSAPTTVPAPSLPLRAQKQRPRPYPVHHPNRGRRPHNDRPPSNPGSSKPSSRPVYVRPHPAAGYSIPPPSLASMRQNVSAPWAAPAAQTGHSDRLLVHNQHPSLSKDKSHRDQHRMQEESKSSHRCSEFRPKRHTCRRHGHRDITPYTRMA